MPKFVSPTYVFNVYKKKNNKIIFQGKLTKRKCAYNKCSVKTSFGRYCTTHLRTRMGLELRISDSLKHLNNNIVGVYATRPFKRNEIIAYYDCEIVPDSELDKRYGANQTSHLYTMYNPHGPDSYDASLDRCIASMINDCVGLDVKANTRFARQRKGPTAVRANRNINVGEELFCNYGDDYWNAHNISKYDGTTNIIN
jgi:SET domain-containing protein